MSFPKLIASPISQRNFSAQQKRITLAYRILGLIYTDRMECSISRACASETVICTTRVSAVCDVPRARLYSKVKLSSKRRISAQCREEDAPLRKRASYTVVLLDGVMPHYEVDASDACGMTNYRRRDELQS